MEKVKKTRNINLVIVKSVRVTPDSTVCEAARKSYHFIINYDGKMTKGLPMYKPSTVAPGRNRHSIVILFCVSGEDDCDFLTETPSYNCLMSLVNDLRFRYKCPVSIE